MIITWIDQTLLQRVNKANKPSPSLSVVISEKLDKTADRTMLINHQVPIPTVDTWKKRIWHHQNSEDSSTPPRRGVYALHYETP